MDFYYNKGEVKLMLDKSFNSVDSYGTCKCTCFCNCNVCDSKVIAVGVRKMNTRSLGSTGMNKAKNM